VPCAAAAGSLDVRCLPAEGWDLPDGRGSAHRPWRWWAEAGDPEPLEGVRGPLQAASAAVELPASARGSLATPPDGLLRRARRARREAPSVSEAARLVPWVQQRPVRRQLAVRAPRPARSRPRVPAQLTLQPALVPVVPA